MNRLRCFLVVVALLLAAFLPAAPGRAQGAGALQKAGWRLTFDDEFSGSALDTRKWTASEGTFENRADPLQYFLPSEVSVGRGNLTLTSKQRPSHGYEYTSGEIRTLDKFCQLYGRLEVRCRFPTAPGTWPAVYLLPADDSWPPEIDAAEFIGRTPEKVYLTNHWLDGYGVHRQMNCDWVNPAANWGAWHTYATEWQPSGVRWYVDGVLRGTDLGPVSSVPMYIRVNLMVGGGFAGPPQPGVWPQTFVLDYIRMYQRPGGPAPILRPVPRFVPPRRRLPTPHPRSPSRRPQTIRAGQAAGAERTAGASSSCWRRRSWSGGGWGAGSGRARRGRRPWRRAYG